jgi:Uma2 family endonuclease
VKRENYDKAGVYELWLIDPYGPAGTQFYQRQADQLVEVVPVEGIIHSLALPGFTLKTAWLWPDENDELPNTVKVLKELGVL